MSLIVAESVSKTWSDKDVLHNVSATLAPLDRVGLVGPNGQGKTTLIRILIGAEPASDGLIHRKTGLRIGYLPQDPPALTGSTLHQAMLEVFSDLHRIEKELHDLAEKIARDGEDEKLLRQYGELQHQFEDRDGYAYSHKIEQVLAGLGFARDTWNRPLAQLSGGQRTRAYLARLLLESPEVLFLDEPTNHLDLEAVEWLEEWLMSFNGAMIVVSHDRYFLDRVTTKTWEVAFAAVECYNGNYTHYLTQREERFKERMRRWEAQQEYIEETQEFIRRFIAGQRSKEAQGRRTRLERFMKTEAIAKPLEHSQISVRFKTTERTGDIVLRLADMKVGYAGHVPLLATEQLEIQRGHRVAIVGPNGCGKTTFLRTIQGLMPALAGTTRWGSNVRLGYLSQTHSELDREWTALDAVRRIDPTITEERARSLLGSLLLSGDDAFKKISELSGGQRSRVVLARLMLEKANVLILDEPTNHLDVQSQEALQTVLTDFDGTVIFVSHDRYLIQALATHIWAIDAGGVTQLKGDWNKYVAWRTERMGALPETIVQAQELRAKEERKEERRDRRKRTNEIQKLQRRLAEVENGVHDMEKELVRLTDEISKVSQAGDMDAVTRLGEEYTRTDARLQELFAEWETLSHALEEAGAE